MVPSWITPQIYDTAVAEVARKKSPVGLAKLRLETLTEGWCVQTLHVGSYDDEAPILAQMHQDFIPGSGLRMTGRHHEIYLSDARRVPPSKLRTILRQPVVSAENG